MSEQRKTLTLVKPLSWNKLIEINLKSSPEQIVKKIAYYKKQRVFKIKNALKWLKHQYPDCFSIQNPQAVKLKIEEDIVIPI